MPRRVKRTRLDANGAESSGFEAGTGLPKKELFQDPNQTHTSTTIRLLSRVPPAVESPDEHNIVGPYELFCSCQSASELLAIPDYFLVVKRIFEDRPHSTLKCPNKDCLRQFTNTQSIISHAQQCAIAMEKARNIVKDNKSNKKGRKRDLPKQYESYDEYKGHPSSWALISSLRKMMLIREHLEESQDNQVSCLNPECDLNLNDASAMLDHVNECFMPDYFGYVGKADEFRALAKRDQASITRRALGIIDTLPCLNIDVLNCGQFYTHIYGLMYHMQRCGVSDEDRPWKCYRCGLESTFLNSKQHLMECHRSQINDLVEKAHQLAESSTRDKNALEKQQDDEGDVQQTKEGAQKQRRADDLLRTLLKTSRLRSQKASISRGFFPEHSSRTTVNSGVKRYKFKAVDMGLPYPTEHDLRNYRLALEYAGDMFDKARDREALCLAIRNIQYCADNWIVLTEEEKEDSDFLNEMLKKRSVPVRLPTNIDKPKSVGKKNSKENGETSKNAAERLNIFEPHPLPYTVPNRRSLLTEPSTSKYLKPGDGCVAYCGGPISMIASCPRLLEDGSELVATSTFFDEEYLIERGGENNISYIQFWRYSRNRATVQANLSYLLETSIGPILCAIWCPILRGQVTTKPMKTEIPDRKTSFVGFLAVGAMQRGVSVYGISPELGDLAKTSKDLCVIRGEPDLSLRLPNKYQQSPVISLEWSQYDGAARLFAVFAAGQIGVWDLNKTKDPPRVIFDDNWPSPPLHVACSEPDELAISFREKLVKIYDLNKLECLIEENAPRSAGIKVGSQERLFAGSFSYQGDCITCTDFLEHTICYISKTSDSNNFFVVPLAFRHEVRIWDMGVCPHTGSIYTVGADGRLEISMNGRIVPRHAQIDFSFNTTRVAMTLVRKRRGEDTAMLKMLKNQEDLGVEENSSTQLQPIGTTLESCAENFLIEFSFEDIRHGKIPLDQISLDLRVESLNKMAVSEAVGKLVICGGEAGLLIFLPCQL